MSAGDERGLREPPRPDVEDRAVGIQPDEEIGKRLDHRGQLRRRLPEVLLGQGLLGDVPDGEQNMTALDRRPPEFDLAHPALPADHAGDQEIPGA